MVHDGATTVLPCRLAFHHLLCSFSACSTLCTKVLTLQPQCLQAKQIQRQHGNCNGNPGPRRSVKLYGTCACSAASRSRSSSSEVSSFRSTISNTRGSQQCSDADKLLATCNVGTSKCCHKILHQHRRQIRQELLPKQDTTSPPQPTYES